MLAIMGFLMVFATIYFLIKGKSNPITVMILVPVVTALLVGTSPVQLGEFVGIGIETVMENAVLFIFSIIFFGVMQDLGVFDPMVDWLTKIAGNNIVAITVVTALIGIIAHLDGATATTVLITIPAMYPIYKRYDIKAEVLLCLTTAAMGIMNLLPWGGPAARVASVLGIDANNLWITLIPVQLFGILVVVGLAVVLGLKEKKRLSTVNGGQKVDKANLTVGVSTSTAITGQVSGGEENKANKLSGRARKLLPFNGIWTILVIGILVWNQIPAYLVFMLGLSITLLINYPSLKDQNNAFKKHAGSALLISATMLAAGVMVGIMEGTGMIEAMAAVLTNIIPNLLGRFTHVIFGVLAVPMGLMVSTDAYFFGFMPPLLEVGAQFEVQPINTAMAMLIGKNFSLMISPLVPVTFLALGLVEDIDYRTHLKFSMKYIWAISIIVLAFAFFIGLIAI